LRKDYAWKLASLADFRLFKGVPEDLMKQVEAVTPSRVYRAGEHILETGEAGDVRSSSPQPICYTQGIT